ncbi:bifunctional oligoribonuclease/PAP phosphatase NrnA [bacterium]|nr:bifunctional oligoribonuclease/PAP phosphatase NrnA [bacterium]RKZ28207.1 MAG: hypothetical protein DRQ26_01580 [bacterium]
MKLEQIKKLIDRSENIIVVSHIESDGDSLGSAIALQLALKKMGKKSFVPAPDKFPNRYRFLEKYAERWGYFKDTIDLVIAVDCSTGERIDWGNFKYDGKIPLVNIDHHDGNTNFGNVNWVDPSAAAAGEMIYELIRSIGVRIDENMASALYVAIMTDTGRFSFGNTTAKTFAIASALVELGADPKFLTTETYFKFSEEYFRNIGIALFNSRSYLNGRVLFLTLDRASMHSFSTSHENSEGIIDFAMAVQNVDVAVLFKEISKNKVHASMRSRRGIEISEVAKYFGGGGHPNAAGCTIDGNLAVAQEGVLNRIKLLLGV